MSTQINLIFNNTLQEGNECSICYQKINKMAIICSSPCHKKFHPACLEKIFKNEQECQSEEVEPNEAFTSLHRCCYCRRSINIHYYSLKRFAHELISMKNNRQYDVTQALDRVFHNLKIAYSKSSHNAVEEDEEIMENIYEIYYIEENRRIKTPKQSNHAAYKKTYIPRKNTMTHRNNYRKR